jgi:hypothetical protein
LILEDAIAAGAAFAAGFDVVVFFGVFFGMHCPFETLYRWIDGVVAPKIPNRSTKSNSGTARMALKLHLYLSTDRPEIEILISNGHCR